MIIDGQDMDMKPAICFGKVYDKWLVSKCGKVWSIDKNKLLLGSKVTHRGRSKLKKIAFVLHTIWLHEEDWWGDGSGLKHFDKRLNNPSNRWRRNMPEHKMVIDTWAPLYDNPPEGIVWEEWEIVRDLSTVYDHISKSIWVDHIDDNPTNNNLDNLRRVTTWDNQATRKSKGI